MGMILSDKVNPVLLRELRRLARNGFVITVVSLFLVALFVCAVLLLGEAARNNGRADAKFCYLWFVLLASSVMVVAIPFLIFLRHSAQSRLDRDDLLFLTGLKPRQIVDGMGLSGFIGALLLLSVTFPVLMLGLLVSSADLIGIILFAALLTIVSACANYAAVACASMRNSAAMRHAALGLTAIPFAVAILFLAVMCPEIDSPWDDEEMWACFIFFVASLVAGGLAARSIAIGELAPEASNRHFRFHVMLPIAWLVMTLAELGIAANLVDHDMIEFFEYLKIVALCAMMLVAACSEPLRSDAVWRRMKEDRLWRLLRHVFYSGGERGMAICLALTGLTLCLSDILLTLSRGSYYHGTSNDRVLADLLCFASQAILPIILARLVWRYCFSRRARHPAVTVLCLAIAFWMTLVLLAAMDVTDIDEMASGIFLFIIDIILFLPLYYEACVKPPK